MRFKPNKNGWIVLGVMVVITSILIIRNRKRVKRLLKNTMAYLKEKTWDIHSDRRINTLHPLVRAKAKEFIIRAEKELGIKLRVVSALRTWAEQDKLYAQGRTTPGNIVTKAKGGESLHNFGLAIDVVEIKNGKAIWNNPNWNRIAGLGKEIGFKWGGDWESFKDKPHFEIRFSKSLAQLRALYQSGNREGEYVKLV